MPLPHYTLGIDLGKANDPTALALIEHAVQPEPVYQVRSLYRFPLGTSYTTVVDRITTRLSQKPLYGLTRLAIDATGVGSPVIDLFEHQSHRAEIYAITITSGTSVGGTAHQRTVPKRDLINTTAVILQKRRIRIAADLPDARALRNELLSYRIKISESGHDSYGPASSNEHDDLLLALSLALWTAEANPVSYATFSRTKGRIPTQHDRFSSYYGGSYYDGSWSS